MKEKIEIFKSIWSVPRYRSLIILGIYILFFGSIIAYSKSISSNEPNSIETKTPLEQMALKQDYKFSISINDEIFEGSKNQNIVKINEEEIDLNNINTSFEYSEILKYLDLNYLYNLVKTEEIFSRTEYKDSSVSENYKLENEEITLYEKSNQIYQFEVKINDKIYLIIFN